MGNFLRRQNAWTSLAGAVDSSTWLVNLHSKYVNNFAALPVGVVGVYSVLWFSYGSEDGESTIFPSASIRRNVQRNRLSRPCRATWHSPTIRVLLLVFFPGDVCVICARRLLPQPGGKAGKDSKAKAKAVSRSARAGLQVCECYLAYLSVVFLCMLFE